MLPHEKDQIALLYKVGFKNHQRITHIVHNSSLFFWSYRRCNSLIVCGQLNRHGRELCSTTSYCTLEEAKQYQKIALAEIMLTQLCTSYNEKY